MIEIHIIRLEARQAAVDGRRDMFPVVTGLAAADIGEAARPHDLGRDDDLVAGAPLGHPVADDLLGAAVGLRRLAHRVHFRGIQEIDALLEGVVHLLESFGLAVLHAPGHGAETKRADLDIAASQAAVFHHLLPVGCPRYNSSAMTPV